MNRTDPEYRREFIVVRNLVALSMLIGVLFGLAIAWFVVAMTLLHGRAW